MELFIDDSKKINIIQRSGLTVNIQKGSLAPLGKYQYEQFSCYFHEYKKRNKKRNFENGEEIRSRSLLIIVDVCGNIDSGPLQMRSHPDRNWMILLPTDPARYPFPLESYTQYRDLEKWHCIVASILS
ncbi:Hypothetical predicted protein [Octopus vulgaris]|uniref:Uncharacterized protein n=1 Tax=Octopus vulgaris TaxID=6645 RepID=A0AA36AYC7_OCTVU|nr:Hypothetical predicted protein [Octopus vulgaris]